tara:strand:+ start:31 stop:213 length:183 start_codon:yes stop_codon:yes gene_type:complete
MIYVDKPPISENVAPRLFVIANNILARKQKTGYPGKCGCRFIILYSWIARANRKLSISST